MTRRTSAVSDGAVRAPRTDRLMYGTAWGIFRGALDVAGLRGVAASLVHLIAVLGAEQALLPVYAGASGLAYDYL
jgi:hypothetical protein